METILTVIEALRQSQHWTLIRSCLVGGLVAAPGLLVLMAVCREQLYAAAREGVRLAGISNTAAAINAHICESLASKKLNGQKPLTLDFLAMQDVPAVQFFALEILKTFGMPPLAHVAADAQSRLQESR